MTQPRLVLQSSSSSNIPAEYPLDQDHIQIGEAEFVILSPVISRKHAEIFKEGNLFNIRDIGSENGTFVNGNRITDKPVALQANDVIAFSPAIKYVFLEAEKNETQSVMLPIGSYGIVIDDKTEDVYIDGIMLKPKLEHNEYLFNQETD